MQSTDTYSQFIELASRRRSCRRFADIDITRETIEAIVDAARIAPSAVNRQPWTFLAVDSSEDMKPLRDAILASYDRPWIESAKAFIICCADHRAAWHRADGKDHADIDIAIATEHICLAATTLGIGSCWVCNFDAMLLAREFGLPEGVEPCVIIPLGYPDGSSDIVYRPFSRKPLNEILKWGKF